jgi:hypothetical protein
VTSFDRGTLLWVDDDFVHDELLRSDGDLDAWQRTFGDVDSRVYRLLNLNLEIATNLNDALELLDELSAPENANCMVFGVLDMRIPKDASGGVAEKKFGIECASAFAERGVDFAILSSQSDAKKDLLARGLQKSKYYTKRPPPSKTMMPEDLARYILGSFKNGMNWIDLGPLLDLWTSEDRCPNPLKPRTPEFQQFPFFGACRDFVERWEGRQATLRSTRGTRVVMRAPETHSDAFVAQCLCITIAGQYPGLEVDVVFAHAASAEAMAICDSAGGIPVRILRMSGESDEIAAKEQALLRQVMAKYPTDQLVIVLPLDERADPFLSLMSFEPDVVFDDLPAVRFNDFEEREHLVRRIAEYQLQSVRITVDGQTESKISDFYISHPETLFHPLFWTFLLESQQVADDLSDPLEMLQAISSEVKKIFDWPSTSRQALIDGEPIPIEHLLRPAEATYKELVKIHDEWVTVTFRNWLNESWRTPYGCVDMKRESLGKDYRRRWEWQSLIICRELADAFMALSPETRDTETVLVQAASFLQAPAIRQIVDDKAGVADWLGLEAMRWPHVACPMPSALNQRLKEEGRYLFVQTDVLDQATLTRTGTRYLLRLEEYAEMQGGRIGRLRRNADTLPIGWREPLAKIIDFIELREGGGAYPSPAATADISSVWPAFLALSKNATRISYIYHTYHARSAGLTAADIDLLVGRDGKMGGEGALLGAIRGRRLSDPLAGQRAWMPRFRNTARDLVALSFQSRSLSHFVDHEEHDAINELQQGFLHLLGLFAGVDTGYGETMVLEDVDLWMREVEGRILPHLMQRDAKLQSNAFFDRSYNPPKDLRHMPMAHGALRGSTLDLLLLFFEWADLAQWTIRQMQYSDGYHFLAMVRDQRNTEKDHTPEISEATLGSIVELFLAGAEGLLMQLRSCIALAGHRDLAMQIVLDDIQADQQPIQLPDQDASVADVMAVVRGTDAGEYEIFTKGAPGAQREAFSYTSVDLSLVLMNGFEDA